MNRFSLILITYFALTTSRTIASEHINWSTLPLENSHKSHLVNNRVLVFSNMQSLTQEIIDDSEIKQIETQKWDFSIAGLHPRNCRMALRRLSRYEEYDQLIGFIAESAYNEKEEELSFLLRSRLLPFSMLLNFQLPRITSPGRYAYSFDRGFLKGLTGHIHVDSVAEHDNRCLFYATAQWHGPHTGINNRIFEGFSRTMAKMAMETLFRVSSL